MTKKLSTTHTVRTDKGVQKRGGYGSSSKSVSALKPPPTGAAPGGAVRPKSSKT